MKKLALLFIFGAAVLGCDKVDLPRVATDPVDTNSSGGPVARHKVLLEDYTGHQCGNCPGAAEVAAALHEKYGDDLIVIAVHAGHFSKINAKYPTSYTTTAGNDWNLHFIGDNGLYPNGTVNRKNYTGTGTMSKETKWASLVDLAFKDPFIVDLVLEKNYDSESRSLDISVKGIFKSSYKKDLKVSVVLLEDNIVGPQTDYRLNPDRVPDYVFKHMLRDDINGSWGTEFSTGNKSAGDSVVVKFNDYPVNDKFNDKELTVVAFAFDPDTREVIEAEKISVSSTSGNNQDF